LLKSAATNTPRIEYDVNGNRLGLLIEEARTNLLLRSEEFDNAYWTKQQSSVVANAEIAPDGTLTADKLVENTAAAQHDVRTSVTVASSTQITQTVYAKSTGEGRRLFLSPVGTITLGNNRNVVFNLDTGVATPDGSGTGALNSFSIEAVGNGWFRCSVTVTTADVTALNIIRLHNGSTDNYTGDGTSGLLIFGAQLEAGSFPTSYIPTAGATATRAADVASIPTSAFGYNQKAGTVVCEFETQYGTTGFPRIWEIGNTSTAINRTLLYVLASLSRVNFGVLSNNVTAADFIIKTDPTPASGKFAAAFADNDFAGVVDGGSPVTDTSGSFTTPSIPRDTLKIGGASNVTSSNMSGHIKSIQYYPRRLTNAQLQELTA
jgi:hypothetical protein